MRGSEVVAGVPKPAAIGAVERMAFVGGWKAQDRDSHALSARRSNRREERLASSREQWWLGARWTMNASVLRSNKEFSSQLQETKQPVEKVLVASSVFICWSKFERK
jgi:hypothetical protein